MRRRRRGAFIVGAFCENTLHPKSKFDPRSYRWKRSGKAWVLVGCPKGHWAVKAGRCKVGLKGRVLLSPVKLGCRKGSKLVTKGLF